MSSSKFKPSETTEEMTVSSTNKLQREREKAKDLRDTATNHNVCLWFGYWLKQKR